MKNRILIISELSSCNHLQEVLTDDTIEVHILSVTEAIQAISRAVYCLILVGLISGISLPELIGALRVMADAPVIALVDNNVSREERYGLITAGAIYALDWRDERSISICSQAAIRLFLKLTEGKEHGDPVVPIIVCKDLLIDPSKRLVKVKNKGVNLCRKEFDLLYYLGLHQGEVVTKDQIASNVWPYLVGDNTIISHIGRIRRKIEPDPSAPIYITTYPGVGYSMTSGN